MFDKNISIDRLNAMSKATLIDHLSIEFIEVGDDFIKAKMPVDSRTVQPMKLLHGGASVALAETLGSLASYLLVDGKDQYPVGLEINANHLRPVKTGDVYGVATAVHIGQKTHVWEIKIWDEHKKLVCISRLTIAILDKIPAV
jgi:1,4-dihydroxy-2-naphthoyl-CoA hydrolase